MDKPYEKIRGLLARIFINPRVMGGNCVISIGDIPVSTPPYKPAVLVAAPDYEASPHYERLPEFPIQIEHLEPVTSGVAVDAKLIEPEPVLAEPVSIASEADLEIKTQHWEADVQTCDVPPIPDPVLRKDLFERFKLKMGEASKRILRAAARIIKVDHLIELNCRVDIGAACRVPINMRSHNPRGIGKDNLLKYWRALVEQVPGNNGKDLELLAIFCGIEIDQYSGLDFNPISYRLRLRPKMPSERSRGGSGKYYDIIYGKYIPRGTILRAVLGSDQDR